jgi:ribosomal protein L34
MPKRTYQPHTKKRLRTHGFLARAKKSLNVIKQRRQKGRAELTKSENKRYK